MFWFTQIHGILPRPPTKSANSPARSCPIESAKNTAVFQRAPSRERQTTALNRSPKRCHSPIQDGATPRLRPVRGLTDESIGVNRYVCRGLFGAWFVSRVAQSSRWAISRPHFSGPPEPSDPRWCHPPIVAGQNLGSFSKGANQRAPDNRAEPLPKTVPPPDPRWCHPPVGPRDFRRVRSFARSFCQFTSGLEKGPCVNWASRGSLPRCHLTHAA